MKLLLRYVEKKNLLLMFSFVSLQQALTALGTYALAKAGLSFHDRPHFVFWVIASLVLYLITPAMGIFIRRLESAMSFSGYRIFLEETLFSKKGIASLWQNKSAKDRFLASIGSDANDYLGLILLMTIDLFSFSLSVLLGVLVLSFTIDLSFLPAFVAAGILSHVVYRKSSPWIERYYNQEQEARTNLGEHLLKSWDNVLLNNRSVILRYTSSFEEKLTIARAKAATAATMAEALVFTLGITTGLPVLASVIWILQNSPVASDNEVLIALLATLPRQLNILNIFRNLFQSLTGLLSVKSKFDVIREGSELVDRDLASSIRASEMTLNQRSLKDLTEIMGLLEAQSPGRYEVRGPNGTGKSTLLLHLNKNFPRSFYLPSYPELFLVDKGVARSTGENLYSHFQALKEVPEEVILLDEWDANLDHENLLFLNDQITELSKKKMVIEVRHR